MLVSSIQKVKNILAFFSVTYIAEEKILIRNILITDITTGVI